MSETRSEYEKKRLNEIKQLAQDIALLFKKIRKKEVS